MKKSLIVFAVLAASGVASAQSTVTLYGLVDAYVGTLKVNNVRQTGVNLANPAGGSGGGFNTSRFGLKGSEDLGGGLKANFVLEAGFDPSTGAANNYRNPFTGATNNAIFGRQSWVGLSGGFGELKLGKMWTPYDEVKGSGAAAFDANIFAPAANVWLSNNYSDRPGNAIYYSTPNVSGFSAAGMYSFGENKGRNAQGLDLKAGTIGSVNVQYAGGPFAAAFAYQQERQGNITVGANPNKVKYTQLNGSYDFQVVKLLAAYGNVKNGNDKTNEYQIGAEAAPIVFKVAEAGDQVARELIHWAGCEIGEMVNAVIRQLEFEDLAFDVVMTGSMFEGGAMLIEPMRATIHELAPQAQLVRLTAPPVLGAALLGMEAGNLQLTPAIRKTMVNTISSIRNVIVRQP